MPQQALDWADFQNQLGQSDWSNLAQADPLAPSNGASGFSQWAGKVTGSFTYDQRASSNWGTFYEPVYGAYGTAFEPTSGYTTKMIDSTIQQYLEREHPELFKFNSGALNTGVGGSPGDCARDPSFGQFSQDPKVYGEIEASAKKYGVPANLILVMLAREGSGIWSGQNTQATYVPDRKEYVVGYSGIMESTAKYLGYNFQDLVGNRALQIDAVGKELQSLYSQYGGQWGWDGVIAAYYSGDPSGNFTPTDSYQYGTAKEYLAQVKDWWKQQDQWNQQHGLQTSTTGVAGMSSPNTSDWAGVNKWDSYVAAASQETGVPANLIKAIMRVESDGNPNEIHGVSGATGLMQIMPDTWNNGDQKGLLNPEYNIHLGAKILKTNFDQYGTWEMAARAYLGFGVDANQTSDAAYWLTVSGYWHELDGQANNNFSYGGTGQPTAAVTNVSMVWGGLPGMGNCTQRNGEVNGFVIQNESNYYSYSYGVLGHLGHPGNDYGMPYATKLFSPVNGTVEIAGGVQGYIDESIGQQPQTGELMIRADNGMQVILGHTSAIHVKVGDRITMGQYVGLSGTAGSGPHLHFEVRVPDSSMSSGWRSVDPEEVFRGNYAGSLSGMATGAGIDRPMTFADLLYAGASGGPIYGGATISSGNSWNEWLQAAMAGKIAANGDQYGAGQAYNGPNVNLGGYQTGSTPKSTNSGVDPYTQGSNMTGSYRPSWAYGWW